MKVDTFANRLQKAIDMRGYKQIDIANKTKISKSLLNKYLAGVTEAKQDKLTLLAQVLDIDETWLMGYDVPMSSFDKTNDLEKYLRNIDYEDIEYEVKKDNNHQLIKLIDTITIILRIYSNNIFSKDIYIQNDKMYQVMSIVKNSDFLSQDIGLNKILSNLNFKLEEAKESKLIYFIQKYYNKEDILIELDSRNMEGQSIIQDKEERIRVLSEYLDEITIQMNKIIEERKNKIEKNKNE